MHSERICTLINKKLMHAVYGLHLYVEYVEVGMVAG